MKIVMSRGRIFAADNPQLVEQLKTLEPELQAFETQLGHVQHEIKLLADIGRKAKAKYEALPAVRAQRGNNLETPNQYHAWVGVSNMADASRTFGETVNHLKTWLAAIRKIAS